MQRRYAEAQSTKWAHYAKSNAHLPNINKFTFYFQTH